uniref:Zn(2)-C6 fungal-type domain-containing protein n=1 Tax=Percolomonas cosmopolitus TaxID=63605 RepID=A0A7S1KMY3_9EUKA|mmetsp:Transcript_2145/g.7809  ORF Transcript_2145/g.7809 Transcript_2145/m.7809 type:complete len:502 (+) Transcript_2145:701-2206(+)
MTVSKPQRKQRKNKYTSHACTNCQKKKIRCKNHNNYEGACERCKRDNVPCVYLPKKKRRGRRKKNEVALYNADTDSAPQPMSDGSFRAHQQTSTIMQNPRTAVVPAPLKEATNSIHARRTGSALDRISIPSKQSQSSGAFNMELNSPDFLNGSLDVDALDLASFTPLAIKDSSSDNVNASHQPTGVDDDDVLGGAKVNPRMSADVLGDMPEVPLGVDDIVDLGEPPEQPSLALNGEDMDADTVGGNNSFMNVRGSSRSSYRSGAGRSAVPLSYAGEDDHLNTPPSSVFGSKTLDQNAGDLSPSEFLSLPSEDDKKFADVTDPDNIFNLQSPERERFSPPLYDSETRTGSSTSGATANGGKARKNLNNGFTTSTNNNDIADFFNTTGTSDTRNNGFAMAKDLSPAVPAVPAKPIHDIILRNSASNGTISNTNIPAQLLNAARRGALHDLDSTIGTLPSDQQVQAIVLVQRLVDQLQQLGLTTGEHFQNTTTFEEDMDEEDGM